MKVISMGNSYCMELIKQKNTVHKWRKSEWMHLVLVESLLFVRFYSQTFYHEL